METPRPHSPLVRSFFFWTGIISTLAYRIVVVLTHYSSTAVLVSWYVGTIGFIIYFIHRYQISERRAELIEKNQLAEKIAANADLNEKDKADMEYIFNSLKTSKERWNNIFIFACSGIALLIGIYLDFIATYIR